MDHCPQVEKRWSKRRGSDTMEKGDGQKFIYSGNEATQTAQGGVGILISPQIANCVDEWIPLRGSVCVLRLKLDPSLYMIQVHCPNSSALYPNFVEETNDEKVWVKLPNPRPIWATSMHLLETTLWHGRVLSISMVMLNEMAMEDSCCSCATMSNNHNLLVCNLRLENHESWVMTKRLLTHVQTAEMRFGGEFTTWRFATKFVAAKFVGPWLSWMSNHCH